MSSGFEVLKLDCMNDNRRYYEKLECNFQNKLVFYEKALKWADFRVKNFDCRKVDGSWRGFILLFPVFVVE